MHKRIILVLVSVSLSCLCYAQTRPVTPAVLPVPNNYDTTSMFNNAFIYPNAFRVEISSTGTGVTGSTVVVQAILNPISVTDSTVTVRSILNPVDVTDSTVTVRKIIDPVDVGGSTVIVKSIYDGKVSSGTSGLITGVTSAIITISEQVRSWSFKTRDLANTESMTKITPNLFATDITLFDGDADSEIIDIPVPITFSVTIPITSTMTYVITTLK